MHRLHVVSRFAAGIVLLLGLQQTNAWALPSFAQQTGLTCGSCHTVAFGPQLAPLGQQFKLNGYNLKGQSHDFVPIAAMVLGSFTRTDAAQEGGAAPHFAPNNNAAVDQTSLFFAGRLSEHFGAFVQATYDGIARHMAWDNVDLRYANTATLSGTNLVWGISLNNNPTVQDLWNTVPAWSFPYASSALAPAPAAAPMIEGGFAQQVYGASAYTMLDDLLYLELGAYRTLPARLQSDLGQKPEGENRIRGTAPYWRAALKHQMGGHYLEAGVFGLSAKVFPGGDGSAGNDSDLDLGYDATYIGLFGEHLVEVQGTLVQELQKLPASQALGNAEHPGGHLQTLRVNAIYTFEQTYALTLADFVIRGSPDKILYAAAPLTGSATGKPDSRGYIAELSYTPFGKSDSLWQPWLNLRIGLQYTWYTRFNGGAANYDGSGRSAHDNNTLFGFIWLAI